MPYIRFDKNKKKWNEIDAEEKTDEDLFLDGKLREKLDFAKKQQNNNNDVVGVISGEEGSGKSTLAANVMRYITDDGFDPKQDMIGADVEDGIEKLESVKNKGALMFDEGNVFFLSTETMKKEQRELHKLFSIFRQKNLFVLIVLPSFFRLGTYFALDRSRFMLRSYVEKGKRDRFAYYGNKRKTQLYWKGKKFHDHNCVKPNFRGRFKKCHLLESEEYRKFKLATLKDAFVKAKPKNHKTEFQLRGEVMEKLVMMNKEVRPSELSKYLGITKRYINMIKARNKPEVPVVNA